MHPIQSQSNAFLSDFPQDFSGSFNELPREIILHIFNLLMDKDLVKSSMICRHWLHLMDNDLSLRLRRCGIMNFCFGKVKWEKYFGDIGMEPALPKDIVEILNSPHPFWPKKKMRETHLLVLIPETVNGKAFHLDSLSELIKSPKSGYKTQYNYYPDYIKKELGTKSMPSHWVLMTKDVIPESRSKSYEDQKKFIIQKYNRITGIPYVFPQALEAATAILMHYIETGEALYTDNQLGKAWTYTRCQEKVGHWIAIGGFSSEGLCLYTEWNATAVGTTVALGVAGSADVSLVDLELFRQYLNTFYLFNSQSPS